MYYEVQPMENISTIANRFRVSVENLLKANPAIANGKVFPGLVLKIPKYYYKSLSGRKYIRYIVQKGDSPYKMAQKANIPLSDLIKYNPYLAYNKIIYPGQFFNIVYA